MPVENNEVAFLARCQRRREELIFYPEEEFKMKKLLTITLILMFVSVAFAAWPEDMKRGKAKVDGSLAEWIHLGNPNWIAINTVYDNWCGNPFDGYANGKYAAVWDDASNRIYVAVTGLDLNHMFTDGYSNWNEHDAVEFYMDADNGNEAYDGTKSDYAQQYTLGKNATIGGDWICLGGGIALPAGCIDAYEAQVNGAFLDYEIAITPWDYYRGLGGTDEAEGEVNLAVNHILGLSVVNGNMHHAYGACPADDFFGMACATGDTAGKKFRDASAFSDHKLVDVDSGVPEPATIVLLGLGGLALIRKRR